MRGFHNSAFDPQTLVLLEAAFDEAFAAGDGRRARSHSIVRRSAGGTATRDRLARGELIAGHL